MTLPIYQNVLSKILEASKSADRELNAVSLVVVSKTFEAADILPVIEAGASRFGENRVQEAQTKWPQIKQKHPQVELHLIGPLQSNKTKDAVALFDAIQSIDREKIAAAIAKEMRIQGKTLQLFVQVNTGEEKQKTGISPLETEKFVTLCRQKYQLNIVGLMCIPPNDENPGPHFALLRKLAQECDCKFLSMGMSADFETAIEFGATHVRVGRAIFGSRD